MIGHLSLLLLATLAGPESAVSQGAAAAAPPTREAIVAAARIVIGKARYATFVTLGDTGHPQARIVDPFPPDEDLTIWVATNARSRKVGQIAADPRVTLTYFDTVGQSYVTVLGMAKAVSEPQEKARHWKDEWKAFYKDGPRGEDYLLIRIVPSRLEVVAASLGMMNDPATWRPVILDLTPKP